jgi:hypothetical protein
MSLNTLRFVKAGRDYRATIIGSLPAKRRVDFVVSVRQTTPSGIDLV